MQQERESAELCTNGCGFFGAPASGGMCSVCWKKTMSNRQVQQDNQSAGASAAAQAKPVAVTPETTLPADSVVTQPAETAHVEAAATPAAEAAPAKPVQKNKKRCWSCKKKVGLTAIECRCGFVFCGEHRYPDQHACEFDFKAADRAELARRNPGGGQFGKLEKL